MESGAEDLGVAIDELVEMACERHEPINKLSKMLEKLFKTSVETMPHSKYAEAIVNGMFLIVQRRVTADANADVLSIQKTIDKVFDTYGHVVIPYANSKSTQIQVIETVEKKCLEPQSPLFPVFGYIIQILSRHCLELEAIDDWKGRRNDAREEGTLSLREDSLLRNMENTAIGPTGGILQGLDLGEASQNARDMGF